MSIILRGPGGKLFKFADGTTVESVKETVGTAQSMTSTEHLKVLHKGKPLDDSVVLNDKTHKRLLCTLTKPAIAMIIDEEQERAAEEQAKRESYVPEQCLGEDCQFFGTYDSDGYCSKCFETKQQLEKAAALAAAKDVEESKDESDVDEPAPTDQTNTTRCWTCNKNVNLLGFVCKCRYVFCGKHRQPHDHDCSFDFKTFGRQVLEKRNASPTHKSATVDE